ncbi:enolase C-terminal domain-like protein [Streptomyces sp. NPDC056656]|uniref:enolase C-terminal domain-like protein n=1 Tax=Streptomyces sp. NPDC056656 TaxID=3345895 RepID=UPI0036CC14C4
MDELIRGLTGLIDQGWRRVKVKVGKPDRREDAARLRAVRRTLGDEVTLMCDANQRWDLSTANRIMPVLEETRMDWAEEPLHADDLDGHAARQRSTSLDIAADESVYSYRQFSGFIAHDAIRVVQPDATRLGGVTEWLQVTGLAAARGLRVAPHAGDMMQLHQHLVGVGLSAAPPLVEFIPWTQDAYAERSVVREGYLQRPQAPGASTAIVPEARHSWQVRGVGALRTG